MSRLINYFVYLFVVTIIYSSGCSEDSSTSTEPENNIDYGTFIISTIPPGCSIYLNGTDTQKITPDSIRGLDPGTYEIDLTHDIYMDTSLTRNLTAGERVTVEVNLTEAERFYGSINCASTPSNSLIYLNDSCCSQYTPYQFENIYPGIIEIKYENEGCLPDSTTITLHSGESYYLNKTLTDTMIWKGFNTNNSELPSNNITCLTCNTNSEGRVWVGTYNSGIAVYDFSDWEIFNASNSILPSNRITELFSDPAGNVWIGTDNGFCVYENGGFNSYAEANAALTDKYVTCIVEAYTYFIGTKTGGMLALNESENILNLCTTENSSLPSNIINDFKLSGIITISTGIGILLDYPIYEDAETINTGNSELPFDYINISLGTYTNMMDYTEKLIWINSIDLASDTHYLTYYYCYFQSEPEYTTIELTYKINEIRLIYPPFIWVCSDHGLLKFSESSLIEEITSENSGLLSNMVNDMTIDRRGYLWLATDNGLSRYKADN